MDDDSSTECWGQVWEVVSPLKEGQDLEGKRGANIPGGESACPET